MREKIMARSAEERVVMGAEMFESAKTMVCASFPQGLLDAERKKRLFERIYGELAPGGAFAEKRHQTK